MSITVFGVIVAAIALVLLACAGAEAMFVLLILCGLAGGSAAVALPALGGSSVSPVTFCLGFMVLRFMLPGSGHGAVIAEAIRKNVFLLIFAGYGIAMAMLGPRLFALSVKVVPMRGTDAKIWATYPLAFTAQNITAAFYLAGTLCCAVCAYAVCRLPGGARALVGTAIAVAIVHMTLGIVSVVFAGTAVAGVLELFRNANYAQLNQSVDGFVRMTGIMPEPSAFAGYGFVWGVFLIECWYRDVRPRVTGPVGLLMILVLLASTSSTAYLSLAAYAALFGLRTAFALDDVRSDKTLRLALVVGAAATLLVAAMLLVPAVTQQLLAVLTELTVNKRNSVSGIQRAFWARQGLVAFFASGGLGIGPGSFRSSSIATAILGATGAIGALSFLCYLVTVLKPLRASTYHRAASREDATGVAATWAALCLLIPASIASPTADPGTDFAILAGASLALRRPAQGARLALAYHPPAPPPQLAMLRPPAPACPPGEPDGGRDLWHGLLGAGAHHAER